MQAAPGAESHGPGRKSAENRPGGKGHFGLGVVGDSLDSLHRPVAAGRIDGHCDHTRIQAAEKPGNELQAGRIQQQGPFARQAARHQPGPDRPCLAVEFLVGQIDLLEFTIDQVTEGNVSRLGTGPMANHFHKRGRTKKSSRQIVEMHHGKNTLTRVACPTKTCRRGRRHFIYRFGRICGRGANRSQGHSKSSPNPGLGIFYSLGRVNAIGSGA